MDAYSGRFLPGLESTDVHLMLLRVMHNLTDRISFCSTTITQANLILNHRIVYSQCLIESKSPRPVPMGIHISKKRSHLIQFNTPADGKQISWSWDSHHQSMYHRAAIGTYHNGSKRWEDGRMRIVRPSGKVIDPWASLVSRGHCQSQDLYYHSRVEIAVEKCKIWQW
jgi:hypothetical protein